MGALEGNPAGCARVAYKCWRAGSQRRSEGINDYEPFDRKMLSLTPALRYALPASAWSPSPLHSLSQEDYWSRDRRAHSPGGRSGARHNSPHGGGVCLCAPGPVSRLPLMPVPGKEGAQPHLQ